MTTCPPLVSFDGAAPKPVPYPIIVSAGWVEWSGDSVMPAASVNAPGPVPPPLVVNHEKLLATTVIGAGGPVWPLKVTVMFPVPVGVVDGRMPSTTVPPGYGEHPNINTGIEVPPMFTVIERLLNVVPTGYALISWLGTGNCAAMYTVKMLPCAMLP